MKRQFNKIVDNARDMFVIVLLVMVSSISIGMWVTAQASLVSVVEPGSMVSEASYVIFQDGNTYYAKNGMTGKIDYSGTNAGQIIQNAIDVLINGGKILIKAPFSAWLTDPITLKDNTIVEGEVSQILSPVSSVRLTWYHDPSKPMVIVRQGSFNAGLRNLWMWTWDSINATHGTRSAAVDLAGSRLGIFENLHIQGGFSSAAVHLDNKYFSDGTTVTSVGYYNILRNIRVTWYYSAYYPSPIGILVKGNQVANHFFERIQLSLEENPGGLLGTAFKFDGWTSGAPMNNGLNTVVDIFISGFEKGIHITEKSSGNTIIGADVEGAGAKIQIDGPSEGNFLQVKSVGGTTGNILITDPNTHIISTSPYAKIENSGTATISIGTSSVTVNHGLLSIPKTINVTGTHSEVANLYVASVGSSQFTIYAKDGNVTSNRIVYWYCTSQ